MLIGSYFKNIDLKNKNHFFSGLSFNSLTCKRNNIFFAIKGTKTDGNKFIKDAIKKGARTIVSNQKFAGLKKNILYINLEEYRVRGIYSQVVTYPCIKFKINFNPDDIIVYIKKKDELKKEYKETTDY